MSRCICPRIAWPNPPRIAGKNSRSFPLAPIIDYHSARWEECFPAIGASAALHTPPWLRSGWGCQGRRLSRGQGSRGRRQRPDQQRIPEGAGLSAIGHGLRGMDKYDAPIDLIVGGHALADSDYGVPGPQSATNAQIAFPTRHSERNADASAEGKPVLV
jgi:hypothetical protein